jgi:hypothetical protein
MIDPNIAMGYRPPQIEPASNALARALSLQSAQNQNEAQRLAFEKNARDLDKQNRLERALASGADETELMRQGFVNEAAVIGRQRRENTKLENESAVKAHELFKAKFDLGIQRLGAINDPQGAQAWLADQVKQGLMPMQAAQAEIAKLQGNPAGFQEWRDGLLRTGMTASQQMEQALRRQTEARNAANENIVIGPDGRPSINPLAVGARSQIAAAGAAQAPIPVTYVQGVGPDGRPQFFGMPTSARPGQPAPMPTATGITPAAPATAKAGQPNEGQANAALYASRMLEADQILNSTDTDPVAVAGLQAMQSVPVIGSLTGGIANAASRPETQMVDQAQRNFINATLRRESGAAISPTEFDNARKQYFPQPGDSAAVIEQKARNRRTAIEGINNAAGPAKIEIPAAQPQSAAPGAAVPRVANDAEYNALPSGAQFIGPDGQLRRKP